MGKIIYEVRALCRFVNLWSPKSPCPRPSSDQVPLTALQRVEYEFESEEEVCILSLLGDHWG